MVWLVIFRGCEAVEETGSLNLTSASKPVQSRKRRAKRERNERSENYWNNNGAIGLGAGMFDQTTFVAVHIQRKVRSIWWFY